MRKENKLYSEKNQALLIRNREKYIIKNITSKLDVKKRECVFLLEWTNFKDQFSDNILNTMWHIIYDILT
jgi:hypothetical protein